LKSQPPKHKAAKWKQQSWKSCPDPISPGFNFFPWKCWKRSKLEFKNQILFIFCFNNWFYLFFDNVRCFSPNSTNFLST
jgi:hypothetical protein